MTHGYFKPQFSRFKQRSRFSLEGRGASPLAWAERGGYLLGSERWPFLSPGHHACLRAGSFPF